MLKQLTTIVKLYIYIYIYKYLFVQIITAPFTWCLADLVCLSVCLSLELIIPMVFACGDSFSISTLSLQSLSYFCHIYISICPTL